MIRVKYYQSSTCIDRERIYPAIRRLLLLQHQPQRLFLHRSHSNAGAITDCDSATSSAARSAAKTRPQTTGTTSLTKHTAGCGRGSSRATGPRLLTSRLRYRSWWTAMAAWTQSSCSNQVSLLPIARRTHGRLMTLTHRAGRCSILSGNYPDVGRLTYVLDRLAPERISEECQTLPDVIDNLRPLEIGGLTGKCSFRCHPDAIEGCTLAIRQGGRLRIAAPVAASSDATNARTLALDSSPCEGEECRTKLRYAP